jgi:hypothetical protein
MPLVRTHNGELVLVCVNHQDGTHVVAPGVPSTMAALPGWRALVMAFPVALHPQLGRIPPRIDSTVGTPVRCYVCGVCGYVESYLAPIVAPHEWPNG